MLLKFKNIIKENIVLCLIAFLPFSTLPVIIEAQQRTQPEVFSDPLSVSRGKITPVSNLAEVWPKDYYCDIVKEEWGWSTCEGFDAFIVGFNYDVDSLLVETPNSEGLVKFDDWESKDRDEEIESIEKSLIESVKLQSENLGIPVDYIGWRSYPKLDIKNKVLYYANDVSFDGDISTNIKASFFDRKGYVVFRIIPTSANLSEEEITSVVSTVINSYTPTKNTDYSSFVSGDKVAAGGALAVLAGLIGVKYGKAAAAGAFAILLMFLKKAWFLIFIPFIWLFSLFRKKK